MDIVLFLYLPPRPDQLRSLVSSANYGLSSLVLYTSDLATHLFSPCSDEAKKRRIFVYTYPYTSTTWYL